MYYSKSKDGITSNENQINSTNTWYITQIKDNLNNKVNFQYSTESIHIFNKASEVARVYDLNSPGPNCIGVDISGSISESFIDQPILTNILYNGAKIEFFRNRSRKDLQGAFSLDEIKITNSNTLVKSFNFSYSYFEAVPVGVSGNSYYLYKEEDKFRLKLDSIIEQNPAASEKINPYIFEYDMSTALPYRLSNSQDQWGYYNGKNNSEFIRYFDGIKWIGANKDIDFTFAKANILKSIQYPTKGLIEYEYEGNKHFTNGVVEKDTIVAQLYRDNGIKGSEKEIYDVSTQVDLSSFEAYLVHINPQIQAQGFNITSDASYEFKFQKGNEAPIYFYNNSVISLVKGIYNLTLTIYQPTPNDPSNPPFLSVDLVLLTKKSYMIGEQDAPGVRVKSIFKKDKEIGLLRKDFFYKFPSTGFSSGKISGEGDYYPVLLKKWTHYTPYDKFLCSFNQYTSYSNYPLITTMGSYVGYSFVTEIENNGSEKLKKESIFLNFLDNPDIVSNISFPYTPSSDQSYKRGLVTEERFYKHIIGNNFDLTKVKKYKYSKINNIHSKVFGAKIAEMITNEPVIGFDYESIRVNVYENYSDAYNLISDSTFTFEPEGKTLVSKDYSYNNKFLLANEKLLDSKNTIIEKKYKYPFDINQSVYNEMTNRNLLGQKVEIRLLKNNVEKYKTENKYLSRSLNGELQFLIYEQSSSFGSIESETIKFQSFDGYGNPQEIKKQEEPVTTYLWGYGGQYPIAEIKNATYSEVETVLTKATIDALNLLTITETTIKNAGDKLRNDLPNAMITSYTYQPLVGMKSKTDARGVTEYYEYDGLQRLKAVLDQVKNVTSSMDYHYRPN
ncbi:hypothetical protein OKW96_17770 [Sphingobacterium sp. KU25419]|nr:hypothetical protein OKW96_17770 [Sphingobacterium sp. KU25419]